MSEITPIDALDEILPDMAVAIEISDRDQAIADRRYRELNDHLSKPSGALSPYLAEYGALSFRRAQSVRGAAVVSGDNDDRFDLDGVLQFRLPYDWSGDDTFRL